MEDYSNDIKKCHDELNLKFTPKKELSIKLGEAYRRLSGVDSHPNPDESLLRKSYIVSDCGSVLKFSVGSGVHKLIQANFCKDRLCPMCSWRRSLKIFGQVSDIMELVQNDYEFLFLTLTVRNCVADDLKSTIDRMFKAWNDIIHFKFYKDSYHGAIRVLEVTHNSKMDTFHPHLHIILAVRPSYFSHGYVSREKWLKVWQDTFGDPLITQVRIEKVYKKWGVGFTFGSVVAEIAKYTVKFKELPDDPTIYTLYKCLYNRRLITFSGCFFKARKLLKQDDPIDGDLVNVDSDVTLATAQFILCFNWQAGYTFYKVEPC